MADRIYVSTKSIYRDALGEKICNRIIHHLRIPTITSVRTAAVYCISGRLTEQELEMLAQGPFCDSIVQQFTINSTIYEDFDWLVEVGFRPGVTDNVGRTAREAIIIALDKKTPPNLSVHTAIQYFLTGSASRRQIELIASQLLYNKLIQTMKIYTKKQWLDVHRGRFDVPLVHEQTSNELFELINLDVNDEHLLKISRQRTLALSLEEMRAIKAYYSDSAVRALRKEAKMGEWPTDVELEMIAQTWSEHCKHKIFNATIDYYEDGKKIGTFTSLFKQFIQRATHIVRCNKGKADYCLSVFKDNAGVIRFNDKWGIIFKVETHNSPSALDPYGGALTGIVGVNRDTFGTGLGGKLIANTDVFCFASPSYDKPIPPRILHPRRVFEGVREGVEHGGNKSGIPTVNGTIVFDDRFLGKPLVYCGTLGIMPLSCGNRTCYEKKAFAGDHIIMVGGRIGKDGIHGATFSSEPLHEGSPATAVQIGDPITQKRATDFLLRARDLGLYNSITDNGAGGLSSSIGEMARDTNGAIVHLERAPLKYQGLKPWEIFVSEAQERFTIAVAPQNVDRFMQLAKQWNIEATDLGEFTNSGFLDVRYAETRVAYLSMEFLHEGLPQMHLSAVWNKPKESVLTPIHSDNYKEDVLNLLGRLNICSKEYVVRQYDHEVQGGSVIKPLCGVRNDGPSDAAVIRPDLDSFEGIVVSNGIVPRYSDIDTYAMTQCAVDEAVRNAVCAGADPDYLAALDNFCWPDPVKSVDNPDGDFKLGQLVRSNMALYDICVCYSLPLISGKDSMKNDYHIGQTKISIPPTLLISVVGKIHDVRKAISMDLKAAGNPLYLIGITYREIGASEYAVMRNLHENTVPCVHNAQEAIKAYRILHKAIQEGFVRACHDISDGGLAVTLAEMAFSAELGVYVDLGAVSRQGCDSDAEILFSESACRIVVEVSKEHRNDFELLFNQLPICCIGEVTKDENISIRGIGGQMILELSRIDAKAAWKSGLDIE